MWKASKSANSEILGKTMVALVLGCVCSSGSHATVFEYDGEGKVSVTETKKFKPAVTPPKSTASSSLRALSREIALQHSGSSGVRKAGLDALSFVDVFEALIQRESAFDPNAVSQKGAMGLGQLMPNTAAELKVADPFEPRQNLIGSVRYFTQQLERFGSLELALAAYNAGPDRVKQYGDVPPFNETRNYIAWIFKRAGLETNATKPVRTSIPAQPINPAQLINTEQPLKGDVSVWEY